MVVMKNNWGEPERAPHEREVWCEDVQYYLVRVYAYTAVVRARVPGVIVTWAHTCLISIRVR